MKYDNVTKATPYLKHSYNKYGNDYNSLLLNGYYILTNCTQLTSFFSLKKYTTKQFLTNFKILLLRLVVVLTTFTCHCIKCWKNNSQSQENQKILKKLSSEHIS